MEQQGQESTWDLMTDEEECLCCRVTYSIYSTFPSMPSAMALNVETGEWFPFDRLRSYSTGYQMAEALGYASACNCRGRAHKRYDEQVSARVPRVSLEGYPYLIKTADGRTVCGRVDSSGRLPRIDTAAAATYTIHWGDEALAHEEWK
ncbi:hypothetical protein [Paraburkholderia sp. HP33-1]|uniref:hypothetical protein n=1 Tax=Paraburkholderia sp. HP33-1 TaxID=2883243 RepID=UPI001F20C1D1|nr:hypothetical protein [Paraburkholderia sp. HP33-1]